MKQRVEFVNIENSPILNVLLDELTITHAYIKATELLDAGIISGAASFKMFDVLEYADILDI